jgi:hypothetical protein
MTIKAIGMYLILYAELLIKENVFEFLGGLAEIQIAGILLRGDDDVVSLGELRPVQSEAFSDQALGSVSFDRIPDLSGGRNPQSRNAQPVFLKNDDEMSCMEALARPVYIDKLGAIQ